MEKRYFTVDEANVQLTKIKPLLVRLVRIARAHHAVESISVTFSDEYQAYEHAITVSEQYHKLSYEMHSLLRKILFNGAVVKDAYLGLIDFYSRGNGQEIFLCYRLGEEKITMWHSRDKGFQERKPISLLNNDSQ